jgi:hypothetical protein
VVSPPRIGIGEAVLAAGASSDPEQTVRTHVELLRCSTILPDAITVSGHVYDVTTGLATVIPAAPTRPDMCGRTADS